MLHNVIASTLVVTRAGSTKYCGSEMVSSAQDDE